MQGRGVSPGIAIGKAILKTTDNLDIKKAKGNPDEEISRLQTATDTAKEQIRQIQQQVQASIGENEAKIFEAHLDMINDKTLFKEVEKKIISENANAEWALQEAAGIFIKRFEAMQNAYMSERAFDIKDVTNRILKILLGIVSIDFSKLEEEAVLVAEDLLPSDTAKLDRVMVKGFVTELGGKTSHSAIMARTLEIPAVVNAEKATSEIKTGDLLIIDGESGQILINPSDKIIEDYKQRIKQYQELRNNLNSYKGIESKSKDGVKVHIMGNIGTPNDVDGIVENDAEGIGLFRTEFLYMDRNTIPSEEEQFSAYKIVAQKMNDKPVIIRTLDIGGDKAIPYLGLPKEENPFLGYRAIRFCLNRKDIFFTQLRAILRASVYGKVKIMFPMISDLTELFQAKELLRQAGESLDEEKLPYDRDMEVGMMIEIPSAAIMSDVLAEHVDFFSIGTNDLIQYMTAVDRGNGKVSHLYSCYHPAVLRIIKIVIDNAHRQGKWVGMCGEAAGDPRLVRLFLGMGLDEFSMNPPSVLLTRSIINKSSMEEAKAVVETVLGLGSAGEIEKYMEQLK